jgi:hypothetical protein
MSGSVVPAAAARVLAFEDSDGETAGEATEESTSSGPRLEVASNAAVRMGATRLMLLMDDPLRS